MSTIKSFENVLLISDLDGTLLDSNQRISYENQKAIKQFKDLGGKFTIATGRMEQSAQPYIDILNIDIPVILYNGGVVYEPIQKKKLREKTLDNYGKLIDGFKKLALRMDLGILVYQDDSVYTNKRNNIITEYENKERVECKLLPVYLHTNSILKILLIAPSKKTLGDCEQIVNSLCYPCEMVYSESDYLEILPKDTSKGAALKELQNYLGQGTEIETICVGDNLNDISMLQEASLGFIVENCHPELKKYNFLSTIHHEKHAIAEIIDNHIINGNKKD